MRIGFIVNPIPGMGGRVGLKGTDGVYFEAVRLGARPVSPKRAVEFLRKLREFGVDEKIRIVTCPGVMGAEEAERAGLDVEVLPMEIGDVTTAEDTKRAARMMADMGVDLIVFVGGDGTARDIMDAIGDRKDVLVFGVPSGVKMYSGIFAVNPSAAAEVLCEFVAGRAKTMDFEIMDIDEEEVRRDRFSISLYGYLRGPFVPLLLQGRKQASPTTEDERENQEALARYVVERMVKGDVYILGPGTTVKAVADLLGVEKTLLGVDIYKNGRVIRDVNEQKILSEVEDFNHAWIIVSPIGHQGMLFGRGNQQISPEVIRRVGKEKIIVIATKWKLQGISDGCLKVDTGDPEVDELLRGYIKVYTDYGEWRMMPVR